MSIKNSLFSTQLYFKFNVMFLQVIEEAAELLKAMFRLPDCKQHFENEVDARTQEFFSPFLNAEPPPAGKTGLVSAHTVALPGDPLSLLPWEDPLTLQPKRYSEWLAELAAGLCKADESDDLWPLCAKMCFLRQVLSLLVSTLKPRVE